MLQAAGRDFQRGNQTYKGPIIPLIDLLIGLYTCALVVQEAPLIVSKIQVVCCLYSVRSSPVLQLGTPATPANNFFTFLQAHPKSTV